MKRHATFSLRQPEFISTTTVKYFNEENLSNFFNIPEEIAEMKTALLHSEYSVLMNRVYLYFRSNQEKYSV
jgi:hypothetical protein